MHGPRAEAAGGGQVRSDDGSRLACRGRRFNHAHPALPPQDCCLDPSASCTTAPLPSDDDLPCWPDPAAAPSARAGSVLIAFWTRVFVTVVHTTLPLACLVVLFGEHCTAGMLASSLILSSAGPPGGPHRLKNLPACLDSTTKRDCCCMKGNLRSMCAPHRLHNAIRKSLIAQLAQLHRMSSSPETLTRNSISRQAVNSARRCFRWRGPKSICCMICRRALYNPQATGCPNHKSGSAIVTL